MKHKKTLTGKVGSIGMNKTIGVEVIKMTRHPLYRKVMRSTNHMLAHYEGNTLRVGDAVTIIETRPISKHKRFMVLETKGKIV